ncbi:MAG: hypothetical protein OHK0018_08460 [Erythrobacter tepidarius]
MKILRTILWVLAAFGFLIFAIYNWTPVEITLWQNLVMETKLPVLALLVFTLGFLPLWAYHQSVKWSMSRRIRALENSLKHTALARQHESQPATHPVENPPDKPVTKPAEAPEPLSPADRPGEGGAGK